MNRTQATGLLGVGIGGLAALTGADLADRDSADAEGDAGDPGQSEPADRCDGDCVHRPELALVFAYDYHPGVAFTPVSRVRQRAVDSMLGGEAAALDPVVSDPAQYYGYVVRYRRGTAARGYTFVFVHGETLRSDSEYQLGPEATVFDARTRLLRAELRPTGDPATESASGTGGTTHEVVVDAENEPATPPDETTYGVVVDEENATGRPAARDRPEGLGSER